MEWLPSNPRTWTRQDLDKLKASIERDPDFLEDRPALIVPYTKGKFIVFGGNMRTAACEEMNRPTIPAMKYIPETDDDRETIKRRAVLDNGSFGAWDVDELANKWDDLPLNDWGVPAWEEEEEEEELEAVEDDFDIPDEIETDIVLGDFFEIGEHRLMCGDSTDSDSVAKLMNGEKADMVFTDPPFPNNSQIMHDMIKDIDKAFNNSRAFCNGLMIWFWDNLEFPPFKEMVTSKHIWHKTNGWQAGHYETMYCYHNDRTRHEQNVYSVNNVGGDNNRAEQGNHPTPKPVSLLVNILQESKYSTILDLFLGSGTTMVAAHQLKRKCYGMELDCKYAEVIVRRMIKLDNTLTIKRNGIDETQKWLDKLS